MPISSVCVMVFGKVQLMEKLVRAGVGDFRVYLCETYWAVRGKNARR